MINLVTIDSNGRNGIKFNVAAFVFEDAEVTTPGSSIAMCKIRSTFKMVDVKPEVLVRQNCRWVIYDISTEFAYFFGSNSNNMLGRMFVPSDVG